MALDPKLLEFARARLSILDETAYEGAAQARQAALDDLAEKLRAYLLGGGTPVAEVERKVTAFKVV